MITAEEARRNNQSYFYEPYKIALSLCPNPEDNYSELIDLIDWSVGKQSYIGKHTITITLITGGQKSVREDIDISKAIDFLIERRNRNPNPFRGWDECDNFAALEMFQRKH